MMNLKDDILSVQILPPEPTELDKRLEELARNNFTHGIRIPLENPISKPDKMFMVENPPFKENERRIEVVNIGTYVCKSWCYSYWELHITITNEPIKILKFSADEYPDVFYLKEVMVRALKQYILAYINKQGKRLKQ